MPRVTLLTGGARSGKSRHALALAEAAGGRRVFVATAEPLDDEMRARIAAHRAERGAGWHTLEAPRDLPGALRGLAGEADVAVVDCLTLWLSNLLHGAPTGEGEVRGLPAPSPAGLDAAAERAVAELLALLESPPCELMLVTNEVGLGVVPESALGRRFRDLAGRVNQEVARRAHRVTLLVCGLPVTVKDAASAPETGGPEPRARTPPCRASA